MATEAGFVNAYNDFKGYGFIRREKGKDVYFSIDDFHQQIDIDTISVSLKVTFTIEMTKKGPNARNIVIDV